MASKAVAILGTVLILAGCGSDSNSPDMGAVPPKPDANIASRLPPEIQSQMKRAAADEKAQTAAMAERAKAATHRSR